MTIVGLDISTSNVGIVVLEKQANETCRLIAANGYPISAIHGMYNKACFIRDQITEMCAGIKVDCVVVEEPLMMFHRSGSSAAVIAILNRFNGIISFIARDVTGAPIHLINSSTARKGVGIKLDKQFDTKTQIFAWVSSRPEMLNYPWPRRVMKAGKLKGQTVNQGHCLDIADAFVVAAWGCQNLNIDEIDSTIC